MVLLKTWVVAVAVAASCFGAEDYFPPPDANGGWRTLTDATKIRKTAG